MGNREKEDFIFEDGRFYISKIFLRQLEDVNVEQALEACEEHRYHQVMHVES